MPLRWARHNRGECRNARGSTGDAMPMGLAAAAPLLVFDVAFEAVKVAPVTVDVPSLVTANATSATVAAATTDLFLVRRRTARLAF